MLANMTTTNMLDHIDAICDLMDFDPILNVTDRSELDMSEDELLLAQAAARMKIIESYCETHHVNPEDLLDFWCKKTEANG